VLPQADEVIVIDNSSDEEARQRIKELSSRQRVSLVLNEGNEGLGRALNQGMRHSAERGYIWTLLLDDDSVLSDGMIAEMMRSYHNCSADAREAVAAIVPAVYDKDMNEYIPSVVTTKTLNRKLDSLSGDAFVHFHITSGTLLKNEIIKKVGLMNERLFIDYIDFDYCFRILEQGYKILLSGNAVLYHALGRGRELLGFQFREHTPLRVYYQSRNRLYTMWKYGRKHRSFLYAEAFRFLHKFLKIIILESGKKEKLRMCGRGIADFLRSRRKLEEPSDF
jgi:rhamnosyltransferase